MLNNMCLESDGSTLACCCDDGCWNNAADLVCKQGPGQCREYFMSCGCVLNDHNHNQVSFMPYSFSC